MTDYALPGAGGPPATLQRAMQRLHQAIARKLEPLLREGKIEAAEAAIDELVRRIEK